MTEPIPAYPALSGLREIAAHIGADTEFSRNVGFLERAIHENSPTAFDFARSLLEMTCKTILKDRGEEPNERSDAPELFRTTLRAVRLLPDDADNAPNEGLTQTIRGLQQSVQGLSELRNRAGSASHGRDAYSRPLDAVHIRLAAHAADVIIHFIYSCHLDYPADPATARLHYQHETSFNDYVDELHEALVIFDHVFSASQVLYELDMDYYRQQRATLDGELDPSLREQFRARCERFDDYLDNLNGPIEILGLRYSPSEILRRLDRRAYNDAVIDFEELSTDED